MIGFNEIALAVGVSVTAAALVLLLIRLAIGGARAAHNLVASEPVDHALERGADVAGTLFARVASDRTLSSGSRANRMRAAGVLLIAASALATIGTFVPIYDAPSAANVSIKSIKLYEALHYSLALWVITLAIPLGLAYLAFTRRDRIIAALIVGYCTPAVGGLATYATGLLGRPSGLPIGRGYYLLTAANAAEVAAAIVAAGVVLTATDDRARPATRSAPFAMLAALLLAASATMRPERFPGLSIWAFEGLPARLDAAIVIGLVVVALIPLLALGVGTRVAAFMAIGLAVSQLFEAGDAVLDRIYRTGFNELTVGFWIEILAIGALVGLGWSLLRSSAEDGLLMPAGAITPPLSGPPG